MSRMRRNNHYHYAEQYETRAKACARIPVHTFVFTLLLLLVFGLVSTTFAAYISDYEEEHPAPQGSLLVEVRSVKSSREIAGTAANGTETTSTQIYIAIKQSTLDSKDANSVKINANIGDNNTYRQTNATFQNVYYQGDYKIYKGSVTEKYGGVDELQIQLYNGNTWKEQKVPYSSWTTVDNFSGRMYIYESGSWVDYSTGWGEGDYYIYNNVANCWYGNGGTSPSPKMSVGADNTKRYYDFYLKKGEPGSDGLEFRFWSASLSRELAPSVNQTTLPSNSIVSYAANGTGDKTWKIATNSFTDDHFYRVHVELDVDANNGTGEVTGTVTDLGMLVPTFSLNDAVPIARGTSITMSNYGAVTNPSNNVGTLNQTYKVKEGTGSYGNAISSYAFNNTNTYTIQYQVVDSGVNASTANTATQNAVTSRVETVEKTYEVTVNVPITAGIGGSVSPASVSVNQNTSSAKSVTATPDTGYSFASWSVKLNSGNACNVRVGATQNGTVWSTSLNSTNPVYVKLNSLISASNYNTTANTSLGVTANFSEIMHDVSVDNNVNSDFDTYSGSVGIATTKTITADVVDDCTFSYWTYELNDPNGTFTLSNGTALTDDTITFNATCDVTLTAHYTVDPPSMFTFFIYGSSAGNGTSATPYEIPVGETNFRVTASVDNPSSNVDYYIWSTDGTTWTDGTSSDFDSGVLSAASAQESTEYVLYCKAVINGVESTPISGSMFYLITSKYLRIDDFNFDTQRDPIQKVYTVEQKALIDLYAEYYAGATHFDTTLYSSSDNNTFASTVVRTNGPLVTAFRALCANSILPLMDTVGIKFYKIHVEDVDNITNGVQDVAPADSDVIHTTVGTTNTTGSLAIYFQNNTGINLSTYRLMAFYSVNGTVGYQTAQAVTGKPNVYRFMVPSDADVVCFAIAAKDKYCLPTLNSLGAFDFTCGGSSTVFYTASTASYYTEFRSLRFFATNNATSGTFANGLLIIDGSWTAIQ